MSKYKRRFGDRKEGRLLRSLPAFNKFMPYVMPTRNDALNQYDESFEVSIVDRRLRQLRVAGYKGIGMLHFLIAAYIRGVSMLPGINRFVAGRRIYARDNIEVVMVVKRSLSTDSTETSIKIHFEPTDTIFDVYRKLNEKIDEVKASDESNGTEEFAETLCKAPRFLLSLSIKLLQMMDYFGWIPQRFLEVSPFHGSMIITDLGSLRIGPVFHHIYNFGTLPVFLAFGAKRHAYEINRRGEIEDHKYVDCKITLDERIADGHYFAQFLQAYRWLFLHPEILESPPSRVVDDVY
ncbi:MAG: hypothetical protein ACOX68_03930 [Candidatus Limivicinus sp.]|jgi:hypothetical protein